LGPRGKSGVKCGIKKTEKKKVIHKTKSTGPTDSLGKKKEKNGWEKKSPPGLEKKEKKKTRGGGGGG